MMFRNATAAVLILAVTTASAQGPSPATGAPIVRQRNSVAGKKGMSSLAGNSKPGVETPATLRQRLQDMEETLASMHQLLRQMRAKGAAGSTNPLAKANFDMWELMVGHLDKELQQLHDTLAVREDMETRRVALYKQAE